MSPQETQLFIENLLFLGSILAITISIPLYAGILMMLIYLAGIRRRMISTLNQLISLNSNLAKIERRSREIELPEDCNLS